MLLDKKWYCYLVGALDNGTSKYQIQGKRKRERERERERKRDGESEKKEKRKSLFSVNLNKAEYEGLCMILVHVQVYGENVLK